MRILPVHRVARSGSLLEHREALALRCGRTSATSRAVGKACAPRDAQGRDKCPPAHGLTPNDEWSPSAILLRLACAGLLPRMQSFDWQVLHGHKLREERPTDPLLDIRI